MTSGSATLKDAVNEAMRDWVTNVETTHYVLGSAMGPHPYPTIVRDLQRILGDEAAAQLRAVEGRLPDLVLACVGGGSNAIGLLDRFIGEPSVRLAVAEAAGDGIATGRHAAALAGGHPGDPPRLALADAPGSRRPGGRGPLDLGRASTIPASGRRSRPSSAAGGWSSLPRPTPRRWPRCAHVARLEGILPALETAHAFAVLPRLIAGIEGSGARLSGRDASSSLGLSGRGDKDLAALEPRRLRVDDRGRAPPGTNGTAGARADRGRIRSRAGRTAGSPWSRTSSPAIPTPRRACGSLSPRPTPARTCWRSACPTPIRWPTARPSSGPRRSPSRPVRRSHASVALLERIAAARPDLPLVPDGLRQPGPGRRRRGGDRAQALVAAGASGVIVADLTPDEGGPFEAVAAGRRAGRRLPRRADDRGRPPGPRRGALGRLPLLRLARRGDRRPDQPAGLGRAA